MTLLSKYEQRRDVAPTDILLSIETSCRHAVITLEDPKEVWDKRQTMYKGVADAYIDSYLMQLQNFRMRSEEQVMSYVNRLIVVENDLASVSHTLCEKEKDRAFLRGLGDEFGITGRFISALDSSFNESVSKLVLEEGTREVENDHQDHLSASTALTVVGNRGKVRRNCSHCGRDGQTVETCFQNAKGKRTCSHCSRDGHTVERCFHNPNSASYRKQLNFNRNGTNAGKNWNTHPRRERPMENSEQETEQDTGNDHGSHIGLRTHAVQKGKLTLPSSFRQKWFTDSACTSHMCNERNFFGTLDHSVTGPVEVGEASWPNPWA